MCYLNAYIFLFATYKIRITQVCRAGLFFLGDIPPTALVITNSTLLLYLNKYTATDHAAVL